MDQTKHHPADIEPEGLWAKLIGPVGNRLHMVKHEPGNGFWSYCFKRIDERELVKCPGKGSPHYVCPSCLSSWRNGKERPKL